MAEQCQRDEEFCQGIVPGTSGSISSTTLIVKAGSSVLKVSVDNPVTGKVVINEVVDIDSSASGYYFKGDPCKDQGDSGGWIQVY